MCLESSADDRLWADLRFQSNAAVKSKEEDKGRAAAYALLVPLTISQRIWKRKSLVTAGKTWMAVPFSLSSPLPSWALSLYHNLFSVRRLDGKIARY